MSSNVELLRFAKRYCDLGLRVIPLACRDKIPLGSVVHHGALDGSSDWTIVRKWFTENPDSNIGICIEDSGINVIDIDPRHGGDALFDKLQDEYGKIDSAWRVKTGGGGEHIYFLMPEGKSIAHIGRGIDIKKNGYVVAPPSVVVGEYVWLDDTGPIDSDEFPTDFPEKLSELLSENAASGAYESGLESGGAHWCDDQKADVWAALEFLADAGGNYDRDEWIRIGMSLHSMDGSFGGWAHECWDAWSQLGRGAEKYDKKYLDAKWKSFSEFREVYLGHESIFWAARQSGWIPGSVTITYDAERDGSVDFELIDYSGAATQIIEPVRSHFTETSELVPPPGVMRDVIDYIISTSPTPQPMLALANTVAAFGAIVGRRVRSPSNLRTNFYFIGIAESGSGKNHSRGAIRKLFQECELSHLIGKDEIVSDAGINRALIDQPSLLIMPDEIGRWLASSKDRNASTHLKNATTTLMSAFTSAGSVMGGRLTASSENESSGGVVEPNLCMYGNTTPVWFYESLSSSDVIDGMLARCLIVRGHDMWDGREADFVQPPASLIELTRNVHDYWNTVGFGAREIKYSRDGAAEMRALTEYLLPICNDGKNEMRKTMYRRVKEHAIKLALLSASTGLREEITAQDVMWGRALALECVSFILSECRGHVADSKDDALLRKIVVKLKQYGGKMKKGDLMNMISGLDAAAAKRVLETGIERNIIDVEVIRGRGRPKNVVSLLREMD